MSTCRACAATLATSLLLAGCATRSVNVKPALADAAQFSAWPCDTMHDELDRVQQRAADVAYAVDARVGNNVIALSLGVTVFWPALLAMRSDGPEADELAQLKGRDDALRGALGSKGCSPLLDTLAPERAAALPLALGERLVYEERAGTRGPSRELGLKLSALRRGQLEFGLDLEGRPLAARWQQDLSGNLVAAPGEVPLVYWTRLLKRELALGDLLGGGLHLGGDGGGSGRLRGQVIAIGVKTGLGRPFDAAVVELFGEVPHGELSTRVDGVMVVDRKSGVLLRLELRSANPEFALRRTLLRIEPAF